jgi:hypothetical protein
MSNGRLEKPVYQLPLGFDLVGIDEAVQQDERLSSEAALAVLSALRMKAKDDNGKDIEVSPRWMDLYKRLIEGGWKWRVAVYIAWASQPKKYRWPETQEELATKCLGLTSDRAIATWRKKNDTIDETISMLQGSIIFDALPDALNAMVEVATESDYKGHADRKLMFEMGGIYTPSSKITAEIAKKLSKGNMDETDLSDEELRDIAGAAKHELERRSTTPLPLNTEASSQIGEIDLEGEGQGNE